MFSPTTLADNVSGNGTAINSTQASSNQLSADSLAVFKVVVDRGDCLAEDIPATCSFSPTRSERAIADLVHLGLLRIVRGNPGHLAIKLGSPAALRGLLQDPQGTRLSKQAADLLRARHDLELVLRRSGQPQPGVDRVTDLVELERRLEELGGQTRTEVYSLHAGRPIPEHLLAYSRGSDKALLARGVKVNLVYPISFADLQYIRVYVEELTALGAHVRFADSLPHRLVVSDGVRAVIPIDTMQPKRGALLTSEPLIARSLRHLAATIFRSGRSLAEIAPSDSSSPPTPVETRVLILMSSGVTDEVAAKQLRVTDRTFRRYVAGICERLDASSRFQAGVRAVERGWL